MIPVRGLDESLQDFACRTNRSVADAYADWHAHGVAVAKQFSNPLRDGSQSFEDSSPSAFWPEQYVIASGNVLPLRESEVVELGKINQRALRARRMQAD